MRSATFVNKLATSFTFTVIIKLHVRVPLVQMVETGCCKKERNVCARIAARGRVINGSDFTTLPFFFIPFFSECKS